MTTLKTNLTPYRVESPGLFTSMLDGHTVAFTTPAAQQTLWGASVEPKGTETKAQAFARWEVNVGQPLQGVRLYDNGGHGAGNTGLTQQINASGKLGVCPIFGSFSYNSDLSGVVAGTYDAEINALLALFPTTMPTYIMAFHEFDHKVASGTYTFSAVFPAINHILDLIHAFGNAAIVPTVCYTGSSFTGSSGRFATYQPSFSSNCKAVAVDPYQNDSSQTPQGKIGPLYDAVNSAGLDFLVTETASRLRTSTDPTAPLPWVEGLSYLQGRAKAVLYFNNGPDTTSTGTDDEIDDVPALASAYADLMVAAQ